MAEHDIRMVDPDRADEPVVRILATPRRTIAVHVSGDLDTFGTPPLQAALDWVWSGDVRRLIVDLTEVDFVGVAALRALLRANDTARQRGVHLEVNARAGFSALIMRHVGLGDVLRNRRASRPRIPFRSVPASVAQPSVPIAARTVRGRVLLTRAPAAVSRAGRGGALR